MKYQLQTLAVILQLKPYECYTFVEASRKGLTQYVENHRKALQSIGTNHGFNAHKRRKKENEVYYRNRIDAEFGTIGKYIRVTTHMGMNRRPYDAYSGGLYQYTVEEKALLSALSALLHILLLPNPQERALDHLQLPYAKTAQKLLEEHRKLALPSSGGLTRTHWLQSIPVGAFEIACLWGVGMRRVFPQQPPSEALRSVLATRLRTWNLPWGIKAATNPLLLEGIRQQVPWHHVGVPQRIWASDTEVFRDPEPAALVSVSRPQVTGLKPALVLLSPKQTPFGIDVREPEKVDSVEESEPKKPYLSVISFPTSKSQTRSGKKKYAAPVAVLATIALLVVFGVLNTRPRLQQTTHQKKPMEQVTNFPLIVIPPTLRRNELTTNRPESLEKKPPLPTPDLLLNQAIPLP